MFRNCFPSPVKWPLADTRFCYGSDSMFQACINTLETGFIVLDLKTLCRRRARKCVTIFSSSFWWMCKAVWSCLAGSLVLAVCGVPEWGEEKPSSFLYLQRTECLVFPLILAALNSTCVLNLRHGNMMVSQRQGLRCAIFFPRSIFLQPPTPPH